MGKEDRKVRVDEYIDIHHNIAGDAVAKYDENADNAGCAEALQYMDLQNC